MPDARPETYYLLADGTPVTASDPRFKARGRPAVVGRACGPTPTPKGDLHVHR